MLWIIWLVPVSMLAVGVIFSFFPPKHINDWYGYRTSRSRRIRKAGILHIAIAGIYV